MSMKEDVEKVVEEKIKPRLAMDGGSIEVVSVDENSGVVKVRLQGACRGCPMSQITLTMTVEHILKTELPQVKKVIPVP